MRLTEQQIAKIKENAVKIPVNHGDNISTILKTLVELHNEGIYHYYVEIYNKKVYSVDIDYDRDFKKIVGKTEAELEEEIKKDEKRIKEQIAHLKQDAKNNLNRRINAGNKYIIEAKRDEWKNRVEHYSEALYNSAIDYIIKYLEIINDSSKIDYAANEYLKEMPESTHDWYEMIVLSNIAIFSTNGLAFFNKVIELAKEKNIPIAKTENFIREIKSINTYINQGATFEGAQSLSKQKACRLIIRDEFSKETRTMHEISALRYENNITGTDKEGNLFIGNIINDEVFFGYYINIQTEEKTFISGEIHRKHITALTAQSDLTDFAHDKDEAGIISIEILPSRKNKLTLDNQISSIITEFNHITLTRLYNELYIASLNYNQTLLEKQHKKSLNM